MQADTLVQPPAEAAPTPAAATAAPTPSAAAAHATPATPATPSTAVPAAPAASGPAPEQPHELALFADMRLKIGDQLPLEPMRRIAGGRASVKVIGWLEGISLLVGAAENAAGRVVIQEGETVLLRAFTGKSAFAFRTAVLRAAYQPFAYLHLSFPAKVEHVTVRNSFRYRVNLPATVSSAGKPARPCTLVNIGTTGTLIEIVEPAELDDGPIRISVSFELHGAPVTLDLQAKVCTTRNLGQGQGTPRRQCGVAFIDLQPNDRLVLGSLLWYQMHEFPQNAA